MIEINKDVVFVEGAKNGAIYDFNSGKVYSVNQIALEMAWIEVTQKCNLKCLHCYEGNEHICKEYTLSIFEWKNIIDQLALLNIKRLIIIGGEPSCFKEINELINYISKYSFDVTLFTNATFLNNDLVNTIIKNKIRVKVSIYGHCQEIHDKVTGVQGSFLKTIKNVKNFINNGIEVSSAVIIMKENQDYLDEIIKFVKNIGMKYHRYDIIRKVWGGTQDNHIPTKQEVIDSVYLKNPNFIADKNKFMENNKKNTCWYGKIAIMENGDVIPCEFARNIIYGNVRNESIYSIINKKSTKSKWFLSFNNISECKDCEYRYACSDCRPMGMSVCGDIYTKNPRCCYDVYDGKWKSIK